MTRLTAVRRWSSNHIAAKDGWQEDPEGVWVLWSDVKDLVETGHQHEWQPVDVEKWITYPTRRILALCRCGVTRYIGVYEETLP